MTRSSKVIFWDFDGTLAYRPDGWTRTLAGLLPEHEPTSPVTYDDLRPFLQNGFPWHQPEVPHPELSTPRLWWEHAEGLLRRACVSAGLQEDIAVVVSRRFRDRYLDLDGWRVFDDVASTLTRLSERGWRHVVVSNHVPELPDLVSGLGLAPLFECVITSGVVGYEKPHEQIYRAALLAAGNPDVVWMVGDNVEADVLGPERLGIPGILVRRGDSRATRSLPDFRGIVEIVAEYPKTS